MQKAVAKRPILWYNNAEPNKTNKELPAHAVATINGKEYYTVSTDENGTLTKGWV